MGERMRWKIGGMLTLIGGALGMFGVIAMLIRLKITLTPQLEEVLFYKGLFAASFSLIVVGAMIGRRMRNERLEEQSNTAEGSYENEILGERKALSESEPGFEDQVQQVKQKER